MRWKRLISWRNGCLLLLVLDVAVLGWVWEILPKDLSAALGRHPIRPPQVQLARGGTYLAIGDSYSAGEGLAPFLTGTQDVAQGGDRCHRSERAYPRLVDVPGHPLVFRACSGALISNVFDVEQVHEGVPDSQGLQIGADQLGPNGKLDQKVSLITVTIGGNDMQFADVLSFCARRSQCMDDTFGICGSLRTCIESNLQSVDADLKHFFEELSSVAGPKVRIIALGYPPLFPENLRYRDCELIRAWDPSERMAIRGFGFRLDGMIAQNAAAVGADYIDTFRYFAGHEPCTPVPWLNYVNLPGGDTIVDGSFHPNALGQAMMARMVACQLVTYPTAAEAAAAAEEDLAAACVAQGAGQSPATPSPSPPG